MLFLINVLEILGTAMSWISLVPFIIVLMKQFSEAGVWHGIVGIITCTFYTFIWGWMHADRLNIRNLMIVWTVISILPIVFKWIIRFAPN